MSDENGASLAGVRVLYVEDHDDTRAMMVLLLGGTGATVVAVASADEAIAALERERPDVLISDTKMPWRDGWALIEEIRTRSKARGGTVPAIAVTGAAYDQDKVRSHLAGFDVHLSKPVDVDELVRVISSLVRRGDISSGNTA
jgi:CheY-like chemotaxis protein